MISLFLLKSLSILPLKVLYFISRILSFLLIKVIKYRTQVVDKNLTLTRRFFKSHDLLNVKYRFYKYFVDLYMEVIKMNSVNKNFFIKNFKVNNIKDLNDFYDQGKSVMLMLSHYSGYEWCISLPYYLKHDVAAVYSPLKNKPVNNFIVKSREKHGISLFSRYSAFRKIFKKEKQGKPTLYGLVADQSPQLSSKNLFWTKFLDQKVPVFTGPEVIAKKYKMPVVYGEMKRVERGSYIINFKLISLDASKEKDHVITKKYLRLIEEQIKIDPSLYLWTHNRFKHAKN